MSPARAGKPIPCRLAEPDVTATSAAWHGLTGWLRRGITTRADWGCPIYGQRYARNRKSGVQLWSMMSSIPMLGLSQTTGYAIPALCCLDNSDCGCRSIADVAGCSSVSPQYLAKDQRGARPRRHYHRQTRRGWRHQVGALARGNSVAEHRCRRRRHPKNASIIVSGAGWMVPHPSIRSQMQIQF